MELRSVYLPDIVTEGRWASFAEPAGLVIGNRNHADAEGWAFEELARRCPFQELRDAVDLIVVTTVRKGEQLEQEAAEPFGFLRQVEMAGFDLGRLCHHPVSLAAFRLLANGVRHIRR